MARPTKSGEEKRTQILKVRVTVSEKEQITSLAKDHGHNPSDFIRIKTINSQPMRRRLLPEREILIRYLAELGKIGSNLNQITKAINRQQKCGEAVNFTSNLISMAVQSVDNFSGYLLGIIKNDSQRGRS